VQFVPNITFVYNQVLCDSAGRAFTTVCNRFVLKRVGVKAPTQQKSNTVATSKSSDLILSLLFLQAAAVVKESADYCNQKAQPIIIIVVTSSLFKLSGSHTYSMLYKYSACTLE
jgi:hypothetical protein